MRIHKTPALLKRLYPSLTWHKPRAEEKVYLTFDDGPIPGVTPFILDALRPYNAKATFFCVGDNIARHPDIYRQLLAEGHTAGNHTHNHISGWKTDNPVYFENISQCARQMERHGLEATSQPHMFRPPYGRITRSQITQVQQQYEVVMWDVLSCDYDRGLAKEECLQQSIRHTRPGTIIVFHDSLKAQKNVTYALPRYLATRRAPPQ